MKDLELNKTQLDVFYNKMKVLNGDNYLQMISLINKSIK